MSRIFWDSMLFIYLLEGHKTYSASVKALLQRSYEREDLLFTSYLALGEVGVGAGSQAGSAQIAMDTIEEMGFSLLSFDRRCVDPFRSIRQQFGLRAPDALHLACASAANVDIFLTGDAQLLKKRVFIPGIQFIADFEHAPL